MSHWGSLILALVLWSGGDLGLDKGVFEGSSPLILRQSIKFRTPSLNTVVALRYGDRKSDIQQQWYFWNVQLKLTLRGESGHENCKEDYSYPHTPHPPPRSYFTPIFISHLHILQD
ncbi:hypothetical protein BDZ91DRAFT_112560 [Kalaharituber pfeilii]|nr:hypothetical protein BDZ91DRAFT_112560 [Kalaharituber pfeilii]